MLLDLQLIAIGWFGLFAVFVIALKFAEPRSVTWRVRPPHGPEANAGQLRYCDATTTARNLNTMRTRSRAAAQSQSARNGVNSADLVNPL